MELLIIHFMSEYKLSRAEAEDMLNASMTDFDVMRAILRAVDRRISNAAAC